MFSILYNIHSDLTSFFFFQVGTNIEEYVEFLRYTSKSNVQPYMIGLEGPEMFYFVQADEQIISRRQKASFLAAFDLLFKIYFVLDVEYPIGVKNFFQFIETYLYEVCETPSNMVVSLHTAVNNNWKED